MSEKDIPGSPETMPPLREGLSAIYFPRLNESKGIGNRIFTPDEALDTMNAFLAGLNQQGASIVDIYEVKVLVSDYAPPETRRMAIVYKTPISRAGKM